MEEIKQIGLNIWGLRGGHKSFCHSDNLDIETPEIKGTMLPDIREFLSISDQTVRFYALEYTLQYKVYTIYRSENDFNGRSDAYLATTLYVPHNLKILHILELLRQISDAYNKDHYDAFGNPNTNPDYIESYIDLIKNYAGNIVRETEVRNWEGSAQNGIPKILPFTSLSVVEDFFDKPYRKEFLNNQEVMFWDVNILQNQKSHGLTFLKREIISSGALFETDGKNIAPQFEGGSIRNKPQDFSIERFVREGVDITPNWPSCFFYDKTTIDVVLNKPFHQPYTYHGSMVSFDSPFVKRGDDYEFRPRVDFKSRQYEIPVNVVNVGNTSFDLYFGDQRVGISGGRGVFRLDGSQANNNCKVTLGLNGNNATKVADFAMSKFFTAGTDEPDRLQPCIIESLKQVRFQFNQDCRGMLNIRWGGGSMGFSTSNKTFETIMLATTKASDLEIVVDGYKTELKALDANGDAFEVTLTRQNLVVDVIVAEPLKPYLFPDNIILKVGGSSYKGTHFIVPFGEKDSQWKFGLVADNKGHTLECHFERKPNGDDVVICPMLSMLKNGTNETLKLNAPNTAFDVFANTTILVPADYTVDLKDSDKYDIAVQTDYSGVKTTVITHRPMASTASTTMPLTPNPSTTSTENASGYQGGNNYGGYQRPSQENQKYYGIYWYEEKEVKLYANNAEKLGDGAYATMIDGRRCFLCFDKERRPMAEKQKRYAEENKKNNFKVTVVNGRCTVESTLVKPKGDNDGNRGQGGTGSGDDGGDKKKRWFLFGGGLVVILALLAAFVWPGFARGGKERKLVFEKQDGYEFEIKGFIPDGSGLKIDNKEKNEEQKKRACDSTYICQQFEKYLGKVWSMECSLKMLDSLSAWNDSINNRVVGNGEFKNSNPRFKAKDDIMGKVTKKSRENSDGSDWVKTLINWQKSFFTNLKKGENTSEFSQSKGKWFNNNAKKDCFTDDQKKVINSIDNDGPFNVAHLDMLSDTTNASYGSIQQHLDEQQNK